MFQKVLGVVLGYLGISAFAKDSEGRSILLSAQSEQLKNKYGDKFVEEFVKDLRDFEKDGTAAESAVTTELLDTLKAENTQYASQLQEARERLANLDRQIAEMNSTIQTQTASIEQLSREPANAEGVQVTGDSTQMNERFKIDMSYAHNQYIDAYLKGAAYSGNDTIDTTQLQKEFGKYVSNERMEIIRGLMGTTESTKYMTTILSDKVEVRAQQAMIDSVLQQFVPKWSPKGKSTFTPMVIRNYKLKINVPITPSDIMTDVLGYLYDEKLRPEDMPIVKYILFQLIFPKLDEEREQALARGDFKETNVTKDGDAGGDPLQSMEGYVTQLTKLKKANDTDVTWLLDGVVLTEANILAEIDKAVDAVSSLYKKKKMFIHADPDLVIMYGRAYRTKYPYTKNEDGEKVKVDFSNFTFAPLEGMRGTKAFFITPKENFKHIRSLDPQEAKVYMQAQNYDVKIFAEWWEGTGFLIKEAIFAYIPAALVQALPVAAAADPTAQENPSAGL